LAITLSLASDEVIWSFSSFGEDDFFYGPSDIEVDPARSLIYVADSMNNRVLVFDFQGKFVRSIGNQGQGPGEFAKPTGIHILKDSGLVVADFDNYRIQTFDKEGRFVKALNTKGTKIADLIVVNDKYFAVTSFGTSGYSLNMRSESDIQPLVFVLDKEGNKIDDISVDDFKEPHPFVRAIKHRVSLSLSTDNKLYLPHFSMNVIQVFDLNGSKLTQFVRPLPFKPILPKLMRHNRREDGMIQMSAVLDFVNREALFGPDGYLYILTYTESFYENRNKVEKYEDLPPPAMRIDVINPKSHKILRSIACDPGTQTFTLLDESRLVYIYEDNEGELIFKCKRY
jgi:DNA-binding beta-propeller fold protein YncE